MQGWTVNVEGQHQKLINLTPMTKDERAAQLWSLLAFAACHQKIVSYTIIQQLTGLPKQAVGGILGLIQKHCNDNNLPPLQSLVVTHREGIPGKGFRAVNRKEKDLFQAQARVFVYDWLSVKPVPFPKRDQDA